MEQLVNKTIVLGVDPGGIPLRWMSIKEAIIAYSREVVLWEMGDNVLIARGGVNCLGRQSIVPVQSIIALRGESGSRHFGRYEVRLNNENLFRRDDYTCLYCGTRHRHNIKALSRDHVIPKAQGGLDIWTNVVTACKFPCNNIKGARTPEQAEMPLLATPYTPNHAEMLILANRRIIGDAQLDLLNRFVPRSRQVA